MTPPLLPADARGLSRLRKITVHLDGAPWCAARVQVAAHLALAHGAEMEGVAPTGDADIAGSLHSAALALEAAAAARVVAMAAAESRVRDFRAWAEARGVRDVSGHAMEGGPEAVLLHRALSTDLLVIDRTPWRDTGPFTEAVLMQCPRPTLVLPGKVGDPVGRRIVVAWDGSPPAARAAADALPLLAQAEAVHLCTWRRSRDDAGLAEHLAPAIAWLAGHGVTATARVEAVSDAVGPAILRTAQALDADLIVMGTYGHARWMERLVGGATRTALAAAPVALLMSH